MDAIVGDRRFNIYIYVRVCGCVNKITTSAKPISETMPHGILLIGLLRTNFSEISI